MKKNKNKQFLRCGSFYFAVAVCHIQLHVGETLVEHCRKGCGGGGGSIHGVQTKGDVAGMTDRIC